jgi:hypothetical protein
MREGQGREREEQGRHLHCFGFVWSDSNILVTLFVEICAFEDLTGVDLEGRALTLVCRQRLFSVVRQESRSREPTKAEECSRERQITTRQSLREHHGE